MHTPIIIVRKTWWRPSWNSWFGMKKASDLGRYGREFFSQLELKRQEIAIPVDCRLLHRRER
jgi:hypothetical protein